MAVAILVVACGGGPGDGGRPPLPIAAGQGVGDVSLGMRYAELVEVLGPLEGALVSDRIGFGRYLDLSIEVVLTSSEDSSLSDDAVVIGVGARNGGDFSGEIVPGMSRDDIVALMGDPPDEIGGVAYYPAGVTVEYAGDQVLNVGVVARYQIALDPPPMLPAEGPP